MAQQTDFLPPELQAEQASLARRQRIADMMMQSGQQPIQGRMVGRTFVPPSFTEGLAQLANTYVGNKTNNDIGAEQKDISNRYNTMYADEIQKLSAMRSGSTPRPQAMSADDTAMIADQGGQAAPTVQDVAPASRQQMIDAYMASKLPEFRAMGRSQQNAQFASDLKDDQVVVAPGGVVLKNGVPVFTAPNRPAAEKSFKVGDTRQLRDGRNIITQEYQANGTWKAIAKGEVDKPANVSVAAPVTPVTIRDPNNPDETIIIDGRTKAVLGKGPKFSESGKINAATKKNMEGLGADLQMAEDLLSGVKRTSDGQAVSGNLPTGSGVGKVVDAVGGFFGASPSGAAEAKELKVVAARLTGRVPRFEGPQSDRDTQLYKEAAAEVGNDAIPRDQRIAAARRMRDIYAGYEDGTRGRVGSDTKPIRPAGSPAPAATGAPPPPPGFVPN